LEPSLLVCADIILVLGVLDAEASCLQNQPAAFCKNH
jgi:hypothetical protein